jgi:hypothetical protein
MKVQVSFGRTRHARFDGPPASVLLALAMVLVFGLSISVTVTGVLSRLDTGSAKSLVHHLWGK